VNTNTNISTTSSSTWSTDVILTETFKSGLAIWVPLYCVSGVFQPMMIDYIRYHGGVSEWPPTLVPLLANTLGMAVVSKLVNAFGITLPHHNHSHSFSPKEKGAARRGRDSEILLHLLPRERKVKILIATTLDFGSAACTTTGLLFVGSGIFTIIYSSSSAWTALISWFYGKELQQGQWIGIFFVTFGLALNSYGIIDDFDVSGGHLIIGCMILLIGTIMHSGSFVYSEAQIVPNSMDTNTGSPISPFFLCSVMGQLETAVLIFWNIVLTICFGAAQLYSITPLMFVCYIGLVLSNAMHALAFFAMLGQLGNSTYTMQYSSDARYVLLIFGFEFKTFPGAVSTGVVKGILSVCIMAFSALFFCQYESHQCLTAMKAISLIVTLFGSITFIMATAESKNSIRTRSRKTSGNHDMIKIGAKLEQV